MCKIGLLGQETHLTVVCDALLIAKVCMAANAAGAVIGWHELGGAERQLSEFLVSSPVVSTGRT